MIEPSEEAPVSSPCIGVCQTDSRGYCVGCLRSLTEIACWSAAANDRKREILQQVEQRKRAIDSQR